MPDTVCQEKRHYRPEFETLEIVLALGRSNIRLGQTNVNGGNQEYHYANIRAQAA